MLVGIGWVFVFIWMSIHVLCVHVGEYALRVYAFYCVAKNNFLKKKGKELTAILQNQGRTATAVRSPPRPRDPTAKHPSIHPLPTPKTQITETPLHPTPLTSGPGASSLSLSPPRSAPRNIRLVSSGEEAADFPPTLPVSRSSSRADDDDERRSPVGRAGG